jgi:hypothetical protein
VARAEHDFVGRERVEHSQRIEDGAVQRIIDALLVRSVRLDHGDSRALGAFETKSLRE